MSHDSGRPQRPTSAERSAAERRSKPVHVVDLPSLWNGLFGRKTESGRLSWRLVAVIAVVAWTGLLGVAGVASWIILRSPPRADEGQVALVTPAAAPAPSTAQPAPMTATKSEVTSELLPEPKELAEEQPPAPAAEEKQPDPEEKKPEVRPREPMPAEKPKEEARRPEPKPLSDTVKRALDYLAKTQQTGGGWGQGGGWRTDFRGMRVENVPGPEPADLGNTCIAVLALLRAGSTTTDGPYAKNVAKGSSFILGKVEKSDTRSIVITDVPGTQMHRKIGPFVDTFLTALVLAELRGKMADEKGEQRVTTALNKTVSKIEHNQRADGTFAGNVGWASVLSQGLAVKGLCRARQAGAKVSDEALDRSLKLVVASFDAKAGRFKGAADPLRPMKGFDGSGSSGESGATPLTDAGVALYSVSANLGSLLEVVQTNKGREGKFRDLLEDANATKVQKDKARAELKKMADLRAMLEQAVAGVARQAEDRNFVKGFGSNGGEEFLSFVSVSEALNYRGGEAWNSWSRNTADSLEKTQDAGGCWTGHHCITGKTFCTAAAVLVLTADRIVSPLSSPGAEPKEEKP
jgi:hypothetical protein